MGTDSSSPSQKQNEPRSLLYILFVSFGFFIGRSFSKLFTPKHESSSSQHPQDSAQDGTQVRQNIPSPIHVIVDAGPPTPTPNKERESKEERQEGRDKKRLRVEEWTFCALCIYAVITGFMWWATRKAANASTEAARIANDTLKSSNISAWRDQRAWLVASANHTVQFSGPVAVEMYLDNLGKTEAKRLEGFAAIKIVRKGEIPDLTEKSWKTHLDINVIVPRFHKTIRVGAYKGNLEGTAQELLTTDIASGMKNGNISMLIYGTLNYVDSWKVPHWIKFCDSFGAYNPGPKNPCADYNDTDDNQPK